MWVYLVGLFKKFRFYILGLLVIAVASAFFELLVEYQIKEIIDSVKPDQDFHFGYLLVLFVVYKCMSHLVYFFMRLLNIRYGPLLIGETVSSMYERTLAHSLQWFGSNLSGEISSKISDFQEGVLSLIMSIFRMATVIFTISVGVFFLWHVSLVCACVLLAFVALYLPIVYHLMSYQMCAIFFNSNVIIAF